MESEGRQRKELGFQGESRRQLGRDLDREWGGGGLGRTETRKQLRQGREEEEDARDGDQKGRGH